MKNNLRIAALAAVIVIAALIGTYLWYARGTREQPPAPSVPGQPVTYVSKKLGVAFQYIPLTLDGTRTGVKEEGDRIYLFTGSTTPETGQHVEVFSKGADELLRDALRRQILAKFPSNECMIEVTPSNIQGGYQVAEITYPRPADPEQPWFAEAALCNEAYDQTNGIRYFLYDPKHPDTFAFFEIGQYPILGHDAIPWQYTLSFISR